MPVTETLELLDSLEGIGFTGDAFWRLHHKRESTDRRDCVYHHFNSQVPQVLQCAGTH